MFVHETKVRVRYAETDQMGYMYYGNYPAFYEVARGEMLRDMGLTYKGFEESGIMMPVTAMNVKYIKPARYDDEITIRSIVKKLPGVRIQIFHELYNPAGELINTAEVVLVFVNMETMKPCKGPDKLINSLLPFVN